MKKFKKLFAVMLCLLMMLTPVISDQQAVTVQAATKMTAVKQVKTKSGKRYGYDAKGKMIRCIRTQSNRFPHGKHQTLWQCDPVLF